MDTIDIINSIGVLGALAFSLYNFWYNKYRKSALHYICNKWTVLGMTKEKDGVRSKTACFLVDIAIRNEGAQSISVFDILLKVKDSQKNIFYYSPVTIFDFDYYTNNMGNANMLRAQQGIVPLPVAVDGNSTYKFNNYVQFLPWDKITGPDLENIPLVIDVLVKDEIRNYEKVAHQLLYKDIEDLDNGSFSSVESTITIETRENYIEEKTNS